MEKEIMPHWTALMTILAIALYFYTSILVAQSRMRTGIKAPSTSGNPDFERVFRVQMNTLEWMPIFIPSMWISAYYIGDIWAALGGVIWIVGRILYIQGYTQAADKRGLGFGIQALAAILLWLCSLVGVLMSILK